MAQSITLQTSDSDIVTSDVLGRLSFAASSESSGSDAVLIGASIYAMAESDFTQISNATSIIFATSTSESAIAKLKISSQGHFLPILDKTYDIGASGTKFRNIYAENGKFENISISNLSDPYEILYITDSSGNVSSTDLLKVDLANSELDLNADIVGTGNINISGNLTANSGLLDQIVFNTGLDDPALTAGQLQWNSTEGTLDLGLNDAYAMHIGEEMLYRVRNVTGTTLLAGQPVYASGLSPGSNNRIEVNLYVADGSIREVRFMGLMTEDTPDNGNNGFATWFGYIRQVDTRGNAAVYGTTNKLWATGEPAWNQGDILYVHPTVPGKLTKIEPKHSISIAIVTSSDQNGKIFVRPTSYGHLDDNHDVSVSGATNGQFLQYNSATDYWVPSSSGNFTSLQLNGTVVSVSGHTHTSSDITNFNTSVSGLLPTIANSGDNRILTSTGSTVGINAESNLTFNGSSLALTGTASFTASTGVPLTITNTGTSNSFVVNDESSDTTPFIIDAAGNVGIGTSSPSCRLHIVDDLTGGQLVIASNNTNSTAKYGTLSTINYTNAEEPVLAIFALGNSNENVIGVGGGLGEFNAATSIRFFTAPDNSVTTTAGSERMRIDTAGNVSIGGITSAPGGLRYFDVNNTSSTSNSASIIRLITRNKANTGNASVDLVRYNNADGEFYIINGDTGPTIFSNGGQQRMRITSGGNVGIGTDSPSDKVHISSAGTVALRVTSTDTNGAQLNLYSGSNVGQFAESSTTLFITNFASGGSIAITQAGAGSITFTTNSQTRLTIASDGKVTTPEVYNTTVGGTNRDLYIDSTGLIGYVSSIRSSKTNIQEINDVNWLNLLKPVSFYYRKKNTDGSYIEDIDGNIDYGLIAEEVEAVAPELCFYDIIDNNAELRGVHYSKLITPMLKYIQQLEQELQNIKNRLSTLEGE